MIKEQIEFSYFNEQGTINSNKHPFEGVINNFKRRYQETDSSSVRDELAKYLSNQECPSCNGTRLKIEARNVLVGDLNLHEVCKLPLKKSLEFFNNIKLSGFRAQVASKIIQEIKNRT